jgi:hypothetical protein
LESDSVFANILNMEFIKKRALIKDKIVFDDSVSFLFVRMCG